MVVCKNFSITRRKILMKRTRKGFTLIELLIVIAVIGALAATMGTSTDKATAQAKAAAIVANVDACRTAAAMYYADNSNTDFYRRKQRLSS